MTLPGQHWGWSLGEGGGAEEEERPRLGGSTKASRGAI